MTTPINTNPLPQTSRDNWITPQEQLKRLLPTAEKITAVIPELIPDIANVIARYAAPSSNLFNWYDSLEKLKILPKKVPPLRDDIGEILQQKDPIYGDETDLTVGDTHFLTLIPELGTLDQFEQNILKPFGQDYCPSPIRISYSSHIENVHGDIPVNYGNIPFCPIHWELITDILPYSLDKHFEEQAHIIDSLSQKALASYKIPLLHGTIAASFLYKVATGKFLHQRDVQNHFEISTVVREKNKYCHLTVGGSDLFGTISVGPHYFHQDNIGMAAVREL